MHSEILGHAHAQRGANVLTEWSNSGKTGTFVQRDSLCLTITSLKHQTSNPERAGLVLKCDEKRSADPATTCLRADVHPLDLARSRIDPSNRAATHRFPGSRGDQERSSVVRDLIGVKAKMIRTGLGIATRQFGIEGVDEGLRF